MPVPLFHFNVHASTVIRDPEGDDLPDLAAARHEAGQAARDLLIDGFRSGEDRDAWLIEIADGAGVSLSRETLRRACATA